MSAVPVRSVASISRVTVDPSTMDQTVDLFSIPALDAAGAPETVDSSTIDSGKLLLSGGEVLISKLNPRKPRVHLVRKSLARQSVCSPEFVALQPNASTDPRYLAYALLSERTRQDLDAEVRSATRSHQRVEPSTILSIEISVPSSDEQRRIADFLDDQVARIDAIVAARRSQVDLLEEHRISHLHTVLAHAPQVPMRRIVTRFTNGSTPTTGDADIADPRTIGWFTPSSIEATGLLGAPVRHVTRGNPGVVVFPPRSVLLVAIGASTAGRVTWLEDEGAGNQQLTALQADEDQIDPRLLWVQLESRRAELFHAAAVTAQPLLSNETLKSMPVSVPERARQMALTRAALEQRDATMGARSDSLLFATRLLEYKQSLITAAVSGELEVTTAARVSG